MSPARGDRKQCTARDCTGTMQFGRQSQSRTNQNGREQPPPPQTDPRGWVCEEHPEHFREDH